MTDIVYHPKFPQLSVGGIDLPDSELLFSDDIYADIGMLLHAMQQGVVDKVFLHGYELRPLLLDQTAGSVTRWDIFETNRSSKQYQRLVDIINNNFKL